LTLLFLIAVLLKDNGIIDIFWSFNFILGTYVAFMITILRNKQVNLIQIILTILISIWGFRLMYHIGRRNIGKGEDRRYAERREAWADSFYLQSFFKVFMLQAVWSSIAVSPVAFANSIVYEAPWNFWSSGSWLIYYPTGWQIAPLVIGGIFWLIGFYFEVVGDRQLKRFIRNPENKGKAIESGLWKYTRHPNYFGEIAMSWSLLIITIANTEWAYYLVIFLLAPLMYTLVIRFVTGVPEVEKHLITKEGYKDYMERTSALFPWFPKKKKES
jgi:steroid 5-alpha reductase family enzyme